MYINKYINDALTYFITFIVTPFKKKKKNCNTFIDCIKNSLLGVQYNVINYKQGWDVYDHKKH